MSRRLKFLTKGFLAAIRQIAKHGDQCKCDECRNPTSMTINKTPRTDAMVRKIKGWEPQARAQNLAYLCRELERELNSKTPEKIEFGPIAKEDMHRSVQKEIERLQVLQSELQADHQKRIDKSAVKTRELKRRIGA